ncbi:AMP-binding protein, partial [Paenibacillus oenotherae]
MVDQITKNMLALSRELEGERQFWTDKLQGNWHIGKFPEDFNRPGTEPLVETRLYPFPEPIAEKIGFITKQSDQWLFIFLMAGVGYLLSRYNEQSDVLFGMPPARNEAFVFNPVLPFRIVVNSEKSFRELLASVKEEVTHANGHDAFPIDQLRKWLQQDGGDRLQFHIIAGIDSIHDTDRIEAAAYDCVITISSSGPLTLCVKYNANRYDRVTIDRIADQLFYFYSQTVHAPDRLIGEMQLLDEPEMVHLLEKLNETEQYYPDTTIIELFQKQVQKTPSKTALYFEDKEMSYRELDERSNGIARYLIAEHRIGPGQYAGILLDNSIDQIIAILGVMKSGAAYVPIDSNLPFERMKLIIADTCMRVLLSQKKYVRETNALQWECQDLKGCLYLDSSNIYEERESVHNTLMNKELWEYIGDTADDDIAAGGWVNSYTGLLFSPEEMDEYSENTLVKLQPLLHKSAKLLELGCASGLTMFKLAPYVQFYCGTDLSGVIIEKGIRQAEERQINNVELICLAAHELDELEHEGFDVVILNSVVQSFHGHNYLRQVLGKALSKLGDKGTIFLGDIMDQERKDELLQSLAAFKAEYPECPTKTDFSEELFLAKDFIRDWAADYPEIINVSFSTKEHTIANELTRFRYDAVIEVDKSASRLSTDQPAKTKFQHDLRQLSLYSSDRLHLDYNREDLAYLIYTSGTTGIPKGAMITNGGLVNYVSWANKTYAGGREADFPLYSSISFDLTVTSIFCPLTTGSSIVIYNGEDRALLLEKIIRDDRVDIIKLTPTHLKLIRRLPLNDHHRLKSIIVGGENLTSSLAEAVYNQFGGKISIFNEYGPTETVVGCMIHLFQPGSGREYVPIGVPADNVQLYVLDNQLRPVPYGVVGELYISGDGVAKGYWNRSELTKEKFLPNPFRLGKTMYRTGDLVKRLFNGELECLGRIDHQEKIRGFRIELGEIEAQLMKLQPIREAVVIAKEEEEEDEKYLCAYLVVRSEVTAEWIREQLSRTLPFYMIPSFFVVMEQLPVTSNGKIDRSRLPNAAGRRANDNFKPLETLTEKRLAALWESVLRQRDVGRSDHFFHMGGHSLKATSLMSAIYKEFHVELPLRDIFNHPVLERMAQRIEEADRRTYTAIPKADNRAYYPLSSAQKRLAYIHQMDRNSTNYNMPGALWAEGNLDLQKLGSAFQQLIERHETLRTSIVWENGGPVQVIHPTVDFTIEVREIEETRVEDHIAAFVRPFELGKAPLLRVEVAKVSDARYLLLLDMHHLISDGVSMQVLVDEFSRLYKGADLPALPIQYKDYAVWQQKLLQGAEMRKQEAYWLQTFSGEVSVLNLPTDYPRPKVQRFEGEAIRFHADKKLTDRLQAIGAEHGATLYMVLLAAFTIMLSRYSGQEDVIVGTPIAGRKHGDIESLIGMFVGTLALRNFPNKELPFRTYLQDVKERTLGAFEHPDYPFEELVEKLDIRRDLSRNPLFDVMFALQNMDVTQENIEQLLFKPYEGGSTVAKFDLTLNGVETDYGLSFSLEYCTALFAGTTAERMAEQYLFVLNQLADYPDCELGELTLLSEEERERLAVFNRTEAPYPKEKTIHSLFEEQVKRTPERTALVYGEECLSYAELNARSNRLARRLREQGVGPDELVGIAAERSTEMIVAILGVLKAGGAYVPIDPSYPEERIRYTLEDAEAKLVLTQTDLAEKFAGITESLLVLERALLEEGDGTDLPEAAGAEHLAYVIYTSGSTGRPKGVLIEHRSLVNLSEWHRQFYRVTEADVAATYASFAFDASVWEVFPYLIAGASVCIVPEEIRLEMKELTEFYRKREIT